MHCIDFAKIVGVQVVKHPPVVGMKWIQNNYAWHASQKGGGIDIFKIMETSAPQLLPAE
ncbi:MAG: hypothetical protein Kow0037_21580 [Calditrichia bacterium]